MPMGIAQHTDRAPPVATPVAAGVVRGLAHHREPRVDPAEDLPAETELS